MISKRLWRIVGQQFCGNEVSGCCGQRFIFSSSITKLLKKKRKTNELINKPKDSLAEEKFSLLKRHVDSPTSWNFPNQRGIEDYDPEMPVKEILETGPGIMKQHIKMLRDEVKESLKISLDKKELMEGMGFLEHGEARKEFLFDSSEALSLWNTGCDSDERYGYSSCELVPTDRKTAVFRGKLSTKVVKDGFTERSGWATMKLNQTHSFLRKKYLHRWSNFSHLLIKCRGDGRSYKVMLHCPGAIDVTWGDSYSYPLHTHGGPYWQYEKIPFSRFFHTVVGRIQDRQLPLTCENVSSMAIVLMDRMSGDFSLELDYIGVCHDRTHIEKFAYESYVTPLFNTAGF